MTEYHWSRHFDGPERLEFRCTDCPKGPCGMVIRGQESEFCLEHHYTAMKTSRSGHRADMCPGVDMHVQTMQDYILHIEEEVEILRGQLHEYVDDWYYVDEDVRD